MDMPRAAPPYSNSKQKVGCFRGVGALEKERSATGGGLQVVFMDLTTPPTSLVDDFVQIKHSSTSMEKLKMELAHWQCRRAEDEKTNLLLRKLDADDLKKEAVEKVTRLMSKEKEKDNEKVKLKECYERKIDEINRKNAEIKKEIQKLGNELEAKYSAYEEMSQELKFEKELPEKEVKFTHLEIIKEEDTENNAAFNIDCRFLVTAKIPFTLHGGQALVTFEEEEVAKNILKKQRHTINVDSDRVDLKAVPVTLSPGLKFEIHAKISQKKINVSHLPGDIPEESLRDKLELYFYKSKVGGGEVDDVKYDKQTRSAVITFLETGAADRLAKCTAYPFYTSTGCCEVKVSRCLETNLQRLQTYSGISRRTILLTDIRAGPDDEESIQDMIEIHFQKPSNGGGEVERIRYLSKGRKVAYFEEDSDIPQNIA
ncbi:N-myc-interactor isoform X2 [Microcaecilia unicolor]|uniref:N-myc-interactor isoform X2 n=1 Tax=Microcaecilia unicolor TaxID=1415580 RepID=A0A6P7YNP1_9AMPH|nr:N-myc-interactor isoform X2 [Microcaecilia unicolor]